MAFWEHHLKSCSAFIVYGLLRFLVVEFFVVGFFVTHYRSIIGIFEASLKPFVVYCLWFDAVISCEVLSCGFIPLWTAGR